MTTEEGNKLIAEFMAYQKAVDSEYYYSEEKGAWIHGTEFEYHTSWDWLMPVVEKIWKMKKMVTMNLFTEGGGIASCKIYNWDLGDPYQEFEGTEPIKALFNTVINFVLWYNTQSK